MLTRQTQTVVVSQGEYRAKVYPEGGICWEMFVDGPGWCVLGDGPAPEAVVRLALAVRAEAFPELPRLELIDVFS
jgi:hypothetical protein